MLVQLQRPLVVVDLTRGERLHLEAARGRPRVTPERRPDQEPPLDPWTRPADDDRPGHLDKDAGLELGENQERAAEGRRRRPGSRRVDGPRVRETKNKY